MSFHKPLVAAAAAIILAFAMPSFASAASLVFVKGGNVWLSEPDGSRQTRLTSTGGYKYASQSENGVIAASRGSRVQVLNRSGQVVKDFATSVGDNDAYGPFDTEISPDGKNIAYEYFHYSDFWGLRVGVAYINIASGRHVGETQTGWSFPAWIDNRRLFHSGAPSTVHTDVMIRELGESNNTAIDWFSHPEAGDLRDGDISRDGSGLAFVGGEDGEFLLVYRLAGPAPANSPEYCYHYFDGAGKYRDPAISPDGRGLAWQEDDGIHVGPMPDLNAGCSTPESEGRLVIPGAINPDWGPGSVPSPPKPSIRLASRQKLGPALNRGLLLTVSGLPAGTAVKATLAARAARKLGLHGKATVVATGKTTSGSQVRARFKPKLVRKLRKAKSLTFRVTAGAARAQLSLPR